MPCAIRELRVADAWGVLKIDVNSATLGLVCAATRDATGVDVPPCAGCLSQRGFLRRIIGPAASIDVQHVKPGSRAGCYADQWAGESVPEVRHEHRITDCVQEAVLGRRPLVGAARKHGPAGVMRQVLGKSDDELAGARGGWLGAVVSLECGGHAAPVLARQCAQDAAHMQPLVEGRIVWRLQRRS